jgi:two-component system, OmpR family, alkaline phosphatase synthesis response regulator PhoP
MPSPTDTSPTETPGSAPVHKILVIDDTALIREAAKIALGAIGRWQVTTASSGEEGIERAGSERFDAILLDVVMPGMDGIAAAERLHALPAMGPVPIVLLTAYDRLEQSERLRQLPVAGVIAKPFDVSGLSGQLAELLGWSA